MIQSSPGYPFDELLKAAPVEKLRSLAGGTAAIVELLDGRPLDGTRLVKMVQAQISPRTLLTNEITRTWLLLGLPDSKLGELAAQLHLPSRTYRAIVDCIIPHGSEKEQVLLSFFGAKEPTVTGSSESEYNINTARPAYSLFEHQRDAIAKVEKILTRGARRVVLHMPTGSGKTRSAMHLVARHFLQRKKTTVIWLAASKELLEQAASEFERAWHHLGDRPISIVPLWGDLSADGADGDDQFVVAGLAKIRNIYQRQLEIFNALACKVSLTIIDEAHQSVAPTYANILTVLNASQNGSRLLGLTATPGRTWSDISEDERLSEFFDRQKVSLEIAGFKNPVEYLIQEKYLARPSFVNLNINSGVGLTPEDIKQLSDELDISQRILDRLADDDQRTLAIIRRVEVLMTRHQRIILFATTVAHAIKINAVLVARGKLAACVTSDTPKLERDIAIRRFKSNNVNPMVLVNYGVLTTGFDAPSTSAAVICRPTKSLVLYSQMVGRATRGLRAGGNDSCEIVTVVDPGLPGFASIAEAFINWEDVWA